VLARRIATAFLAVTLTFGATACDFGDSDEVDQTEEELEDKADEVEEDLRDATP
jgi:hypothetical protein